VVTNFTLGAFSAHTEVARELIATAAMSARRNTENRMDNTMELLQ
jgi:hypothetical protein